MDDYDWSNEMDSVYERISFLERMLTEAWPKLFDGEEIKW